MNIPSLPTTPPPPLHPPLPVKRLASPVPGRDHQMSIGPIEVQMNHVNPVQAALPGGALLLPAIKASIRPPEASTNGKPGIRMGQGSLIAPHRQFTVIAQQRGPQAYCAFPFEMGDIEPGVGVGGFYVVPARSTGSTRSAMLASSDVNVASPLAISAENVMSVGMSQAAILSRGDDRLLATNRLDSCNAVALCTAKRRMITHLLGGSWTFSLRVSSGDGALERNATISELLRDIIREAFADSRLSGHRPRIILAFGKANCEPAMELDRNLRYLGEVRSLPNDWLSHVDVAVVHNTSSLVMDAQGNFLGSQDSIRAYSN
jgi:hypothetical protein